MKIIQRTSIAFAVALTGSAWAAPKTVALNVPGMTCPTCPITGEESSEQGAWRFQDRYRSIEEAAIRSSRSAAPCRMER